MQTRFIAPLDILNFRGNKSFGDAGEHGESQMPPQPSIFAGALRSFWLAEQKVDMAAFAKNTPFSNSVMQAQLGTPENLGSFRVGFVWLAKTASASSAQTSGLDDIYIPLPADVVVLEKNVHTLKPLNLPQGLQTSSIVAQQAVLKAKAEKPATGLWLNLKGFQAYLHGEKIERDVHLIETKKLWGTDERLGIALSAATRTADDGKIYTTEAIALRENIGFYIGINGANNYPQNGLLRLGGDGRGAAMHSCALLLPEPDWQKIETQKHFKIILTTPALFNAGWHWGQENTQVKIGNGTATLVSAAVNRFGVISGWDLAKWQPKDAERITPAGSVYWLENYTGDIASLQAQLQQGLVVDTLHPSRRAEGYNHFMIANWNK
jgi:CRISPR-associated protein Cmr3